MTRAAAWLVLFLAGQAATLSLVLAGPHSRYQHFVSPERPLGQFPLAPLPVLAIEALAVLVGLLAARREVGALLRGAGRWWVLGLAAGVTVGSAAAPSRDLAAFALDLGIAAGLQFLHLGAVVLFALALPAAALDTARGVTVRFLGPRPDDDAPEPGGVDTFAMAGAVWVTAVALILAVFSYQLHPHIPDEMGYLLQARYFAAGKLALPMPPVPGAFELDAMMFEAGRWFCPTSPGWPAALAVGALLGVPWLVNPVLAGLDVLLLYVLLRELYPRRTARLAVLLFCVSPWQLLLAMSYMTHHWSLLCALVAAIMVARMRREPRTWHALAGGAAIGMASLIRPLEGLAVAFLLGLWSLGARGRWWRFGPSALLTLATAAVGALVLPYNAFLMGSARIFPNVTYFDRRYWPGANALGFGADRGFQWAHDPFPGHGWRDVLVNSDLNTFATNVELLGWATGSLVVLVLFVLGGGLRRSDRLMVAVILGVVAIHACYWSAGGPDFGARYWFLVIVPCLALTARGLERWEAGADAADGGPRGGAVLAAAAALGLGALLLFVPWRAADKYRDYRNSRPGVARLVRDARFERGLVLVRTLRNVDYAAAIVYGALDSTAATPLVAWDRTAAARDSVLRTWPDRRVWFVDGPSVTGDGYRVVAGPLTADEARGMPRAAPRP